MNGKIRHLKVSTNEYDWLGEGVYFWVDSPERALDWAQIRDKRIRNAIVDPYVIGAYIHLGRCLNLTDYAALKEVGGAHKALIDALEITKSPKPENDRRDSSGTPLRRKLDCAVIQMLHQVRAQAKLSPYDTVLGVFEEGDEVFPGAAIREKTHIQIAVVNPEDCICGYFKVPGI